MICPLCHSKGETFFTDNQQQFYQCKSCKGIFLSQEQLPAAEEEKYRYQQHNNEVGNKGYQKFVSPITNGVLRDFESSHLGLDFGAGTGPVITKMLKDCDFQIEIYDPFFHPNSELLKRKYDYIVCCEVIEHFHHPAKEFELLKNLLNKHGKLYCMTEVYNNSIDFGKWWYKNDFTHVFFYQKATFEFIKEKIDFQNIEIDGNLIVFSV